MIEDKFFLSAEKKKTAQLVLLPPKPISDQNRPDPAELVEVQSSSKLQKLQLKEYRTWTESI